MNESRTQRIQSLLETRFAPAHVTVRDDSAHHAGHVGAQGGAGHFAVRIESDAFRGRDRLQRHRMVYDALAGLLPAEIHALNIEAVATDEIHTSRTS